jgi:hypothetical protein
MNARALTFVHLSDIHLVKDFSDVSKYDLDAGIRHGIVKDLQRLRSNFEETDGILVSGDIAFAGKVDEYERAIEWLNEICGAVGCDPSLVWCVPGNHDIDQSVQKTYPSLLDTHQFLRRSENLGQDLRERLDNKDNGSLLFQPLRTYHEQFGATYGCPTTAERPWWEDTLLLNDGSRLRIRGLNSAFCSSRLDHKDNARLIVGPMQTVYFPEDDVVYLTLCHHPPDWLIDGEDCEQALSAHSHIQLFGHKHLHKHRKIDNSVVLSSGAVHPVRSERQWEPRYYLLSLIVQSDKEERHLQVTLFPRVWDSNSRTFVADRGTDSSGAIIEIIRLPSWSQAVDDSQPNAEEAITVVSNRKKLIHQFMLLPFHTQLAILHKLKLFSEEEMATTPDTELFISSFARAKEIGVLDSLWDAIEAQGS